MLLTGALTVVAPGSTVQIVVAIIIVMMNMLYVMKKGPYADQADDFLAFATSMQMVFTLLVAVLLMTDTNSTYHDATMADAVLIGVNSLSLFALVFSITALHPKMRKRLNKFQSGDDAEKVSSKVVPISPGGSESFKGGAASASAPLVKEPKNEILPTRTDEAAKLRSWHI